VKAAIFSTFDEPAFPAGADHAEDEFAEDLQREAFGEPAAVGHLLADVLEYLLKCDNGRLILEQLQRAEQRDAGLEQIGQLRIEDGEGACADAPAEETASRGAGLAGEVDLHRKQLARREHRQRVLLARRRHGPRDLLAGQFTGDVGEVGHGGGGVRIQEIGISDIARCRRHNSRFSSANS
jgi:hypothetical protein